MHPGTEYFRQDEAKALGSSFFAKGLVKVQATGFFKDPGKEAHGRGHSIVSL